MQRPCVRLVECRAVAVACRMGSGWTVGVDWGGFGGDEGAGGGEGFGGEEEEEREAAIN